MKDYTWLEPAIRKVADWSKEGMLTKGGSLLSIFENDAKVIYESAENLRHKLYIENNDLRGTIMRADYEPGTKLGKGRKEFSIWSDVEWWADRDLLLLDSAQEAPLLVRSMGPDGGLWEYRVVLTEDGYINSNEIAIGDRITQIGSARGEAADQRGSVNIGQDNSYLEFSTPFTKFGWEFPVTDLAWKAMQKSGDFYALAPAFDKDNMPQGKVLSASMLDMKFKQETDRQIDLWLTYGKSAGKFEGAYLDRLTQKQFKLGPGFYEWMKYARNEYYSPASFSIEWLANLLSKRWHNNVAIEDRYVDFGTGTLGLTLFHEACAKYSLKSALEPWNINNETSGGGHDGKHTGVVVNKKTYVGAFLPNFGTVRVHYMAQLDDDKFEKRRYRGMSIRSGEFIALNTGFGNGAKANIYIVKDQTENGFGHGIGLWSPIGGVLGSNENSRWTNTEGKKNQYSIFRDEAFTVVIKDPYAIMRLIPALK